MMMMMMTMMVVEVFAINIIIICVELVMYLCLLFVWRFAHNISATGTDPGFFPQTGWGGVRGILRRLYRFFLKSNTPPPQICTSVEPTEKTDIITVIDNWYNLQHLCILIIVYVHVHQEDGVTNIGQDELKLTRQKRDNYQHETCFIKHDNES